jgi:hypothetical protein
MKEQRISACPVPSEQQPIREYEALKESWFFGWEGMEEAGTQALRPYRRKLAWAGFWGWLLAMPIALASFPWHKFPLRFCLASSLGAGLAAALVLLRLYLGWYYIRDRLNAERVVYEESGWYDGQVWDKPPEVLARDRLIATYQVTPILQQLRQSAIILGIAFAANSLCWLLLDRLS